MKKIQFISFSFNISEIVDIIYDDLLINKSDFKYIKILVKIYDKNNVLLEPNFVYKQLQTKFKLSRYKYHTNLNSKFKTFKDKYIKSEISSFVIDIKLKLNNENI
jgi:hypothetical protein